MTVMFLIQASPASRENSVLNRRRQTSYYDVAAEWSVGRLVTAVLGKHPKQPGFWNLIRLSLFPT
jgi:hypothetical protein